MIKEVKKDDKIVGIIVVMLLGMGFDKFGEVFFDRMFDVGIVE